MNYKALFTASLSGWRCGIKFAYSISMENLLLCSHNPILVKSLYGPLRDEGYSVEVVDHPALAVQMTLRWNYAAIIIDSESFGLSAGEAIQIIRAVSPDIPVVVIGDTGHSMEALSIGNPVDLEEFKQVIHDIGHVHHHCNSLS